MGTTRRAKLGLGVALSEYFFDWVEEPGEHHYRNAFRGESVTVPGLSRFGELTEVSSADVGCRLVWRFALELATGAKPVRLFSAPTAASVFKTVETDTLRHFSTLRPQV